MIEPISGTLGVALFNALKDPFKKTYTLVKGKVEENKHNQIIDIGLKNLVANIEKLIQVKTIYKGNQIVDLNSFYIPTQIFKDDSRIEAKEVSNIDTKNIVLEGTVGQGKSILLRYLAYKEANIGKRIPIFFELRRLGNHTIKQALMEIIVSWIPELNENDFNTLLSSESFCIFLDGFDELNQNQIINSINEIELLTNQYPSTQIVISPRPDAGIQKSNNFHVYKLAPYTISEQFQLVRKLVESTEDVEILKNSIRESDNEIKGLLQTPLMVTLYIMKYNFEFEVPKNQVEFYKDLFSLLISRHDKTKAGFIRNFNSGLNESELEECFKAFCFYTANAKKLILTQSEAIDFIKKSSEKINISDNPYRILDDFVKVVCLLLNDGLDFTFIHRSIQEYFYASFIVDKPSSVKEDFFKKLSYSHRDSRYLSNVVRFLANMDTYSYYKYFKYPVFLAFIQEFQITESQNELLSKVYYVVIENDSKVDLEIFFVTDNDININLVDFFSPLSNFIQENSSNIQNVISPNMVSYTLSIGLLDLENVKKLDKNFSSQQLCSLNTHSISLGKIILKEADNMRKYIESKESIDFDF